MDGLDGLVGGCLLVNFIVLISYSDLNLLPIVATFLAFLIFNWSPAKIFMGDTGSTFLGLLFFHLTFNSGSYTTFFAFAFINTALFADASICILRSFKRQNIFKPHKLIFINGCIRAGINLRLHFYIINTFILFLIYHYLGLYYLILGSFVTLIMGLYLIKSTQYL